jgi:hypothetical protein
MPVPQHGCYHFCATCLLDAEALQLLPVVPLVVGGRGVGVAVHLDLPLLGSKEVRVRGGEAGRYIPPPHCTPG